MSRRAILVDVVRCGGCGACVEACQEANGQPAHEAKRFDAQTFTFLSEPQEGLYVRRLCMHCATPTCVSVCPVGALRKRSDGPVIYDAARCMGCRYCLIACPFGVPTYEWHAVSPRVRKCQMCASRRGKGPACAEACPEEATVTGRRDALVRQARERLRAEPKRYHPQIYGLTEAGGTDVLVIGPKRPAALGLPAGIPSRPLSDLTWRALRCVPHVAVAGALVLGGVYWITRRREAVQRAENPDGERDA